MKNHDASNPKKRVIKICIASVLCLALVIAGIALWPRETGPVFSEEPIPLPESSGDSWVSYKMNDNTLDTEVDVAISSEAEPYFTKYDTTIFKGVLTRVTDISVSFDINRGVYHSLMEFWVEEVYRGDCKKGDYVVVMMHYDRKANHYDAEIGSRSINMVVDYADEEMFGEDNLYQSIEGLADYSTIDDWGLRFVETSHGLAFASLIHSDIQDATTLEEVEAYIRKMIKETQ